MTRRVLAAHLDVTEETLRMWEADEGPGPRVRDHALILCEQLGLSPSMLIFGRERRV